MLGSFAATVGGVARQAETSFDVVDPATEEVVASAPACSAQLLDEAVAAAAAAFDDWRVDESRRRVALRAAAAVVQRSTDELAALITAEQGKPTAAARAECANVVAVLSYYADTAIPRDVLRDDGAGAVEVVRRPFGVVAGITPWNYPLALASWKIGPALLMGNTVVLKPSPFTPLATLRLGELLRDVVPPGVLNVLSGDDELGARLSSHPGVRKVSFTGSVAAGRKVAAAAAVDLKRVTLELGGNDPALILDDADVAATADALFWSAFANSGQICFAVKRVYAHERVYDEVVDALASRADAVTVGPGCEPGTQLGPVSTAPQFERVRDLLADAVSGGARVAAGGASLDRPGYFVRPTVLADVDDGVRVVDEEQFGPVLPVVRVRSDDDAVARANRGRFGLTASVWSGDVDRAAALAARIECGTAWVNTHLALTPDQPFGGAKWSGIGAEHGLWGPLAYSEPQVLHAVKA